MKYWANVLTTYRQVMSFEHRTSTFIVLLPNCKMHKTQRNILPPSMYFTELVSRCNLDLTGVEVLCYHVYDIDLFRQHISSKLNVMFGHRRVITSDSLIIATQWRHMATWILINIGSVYGLIPHGTTPIPEPILTCHHMCSLAFTSEEIHKCSDFTFSWLVPYFSGASE